MLVSFIDVELYITMVYSVNNIDLAYVFALMISFHYSKLLAELSSAELKNMELFRKKFSVFDRPNEMCLIQTKLVILIILCLFEPIYCQILSVGNFET